MSSIKKTFSVKRAARLIGITPGRLRQLIRAGQCESIKVEDDIYPAGYVYQVPETEVRRLCAKPRNGGRPRVGD